MARITVEDCLRKVQSRFELVHLAAKRARMLVSGAEPLVENDNREIVVALREIAEGKVYFEVAEGEELEPPDESIARPEGEKDEDSDRAAGEG